jgi:hypothetical protein
MDVTRVVSATLAPVHAAMAAVAPVIVVSSILPGVTLLLLGTGNLPLPVLKEIRVM